MKKIKAYKKYITILHSADFQNDITITIVKYFKFFFMINKILRKLFSKDFKNSEILALFLPSKGMKTIFIVEDETGIRDALQLLLSFENYDVRSFSSVKTFNERDKSVVPDVFILDVMLPDGLGTDLCNQLKQEPQTSEIPVMIISAHAKSENVIKACEADEFIAKPFDIDDVLLKIEKITQN